MNNARKNLLQVIPLQIRLSFLDAILINIGFLIAFLIRYGLPIPVMNFLPYKRGFVFFTLIHILALALFKVYKDRFKSSWELFRSVSLGLFLGTLLSFSSVYVFRLRWGAFPASVFLISFPVNLLLIFTVNQVILKAKKRIRKQKKCHNKCPKCNSSNIDSSTADYDDPNYYMSCRCLTCNSEFFEVYEYAGSELAEHHQEWKHL